MRGREVGGGYFVMVAVTGYSHVLVPSSRDCAVERSNHRPLKQFQGPQFSWRTPLPTGSHPHEKTKNHPWKMSDLVAGTGFEPVTSGL
jgi:hypothetical protein